MNAHRVKATLTQDGTLTLNDLPFYAGDSVEVIVLARIAKLSTENLYPLRGTPILYDNPTAPVAEQGWQVLR